MPNIRFGLLGLVCSACSADSVEDSALVDSDLVGSQTPLQFPFPVLERDRMTTPVMGVDHDPVEQDDGIASANCLAYDGRGFPWCYDGHDGVDFDLLGGFEAMDNGSATVIAGAPGDVVKVVDGNYDRCHLDLSTFEPNCDGHEMKANKVVVEHEGGYRTLYLHFMKDSIVVAEGDLVETGDPLGLVGSSGYSTGPHVHFELEDPEGNTFDPYAGEYSQPESWWCDQRGPEELPGPCE